ncbi:hypothetical protein ASPCADRAFT_209324 [Aspergillus carbonarius ITEM 5010]|uniref:Uncharacterized protein n=1 Tax=Aspergillus carbonarius (strain ITEM 5010) TaxID=602072 RepID=A0A1R3RFX7_ASPC5|nr:hypothetical protein ASPCADRAFT_209324 [Aspergillus carbonarius ITEM 5010]
MVWKKQRNRSFITSRTHINHHLPHQFIPAHAEGFVPDPSRLPLMSPNPAGSTEYRCPFSSSTRPGDSLSCPTFHFPGR